ncbi:hypothetical protein [Sporomusa termitida]|uniref:Uncharacterized protein n=1 Tax=Sporomusa termitida TaxID=2377 RepID=A0A517DUJ5_9FIRM|nr:hypothetical protein [Sporomusa termitida]QDR81019.1 hypothetical protein SPTER_23740 [Sporomusa termitida]
MKSWLLVAILLSVIVLAGAIAAVPAAAAKGSNQDEDMTREKADEKKGKKLRHGYIKHDGNKVYYYW